MATGMEMMVRALLPKGLDPAKLMADAQDKVSEIITLCQLAENRLAAIEATVARNEAVLQRIEQLMQPTTSLRMLNLIESA